MSRPTDAQLAETLEDWAERGWQVRDATAAKQLNVHVEMVHALIRTRRLKGELIGSKGATRYKVDAADLLRVRNLMR